MTKYVIPLLVPKSPLSSIKINIIYEKPYSYKQARLSFCRNSTTKETKNHEKKESQKKKREKILATDRH